MEEQVDMLQELQDQYDQLLELSAPTMQTNVALHRRVIQQMARDNACDALEMDTEGKVAGHKYWNTLLNVHSLRLNLRLQQVKAAYSSEKLRGEMEVKRQKAIECSSSFQEFKRQVALQAEFALTGKQIPEKILDEVEEFELEKDMEVEELRGSNLSLKNRLAKLEEALRKKDELSDNLHLIDFEQLKIENQALSEKHDQQNEELYRLRKKVIVTAHAVTHMREKVQFTQQEHLALKSELAQLDLDLAAQRDTLTNTHREHAEIRSDVATHHQQIGIMNSEAWGGDYVQNTEYIKQLMQDVAQLKSRHEQMMKFIQLHGGKACGC